ncbi:MAG: hypothetical protein JO000_11485, partial [Alphaproteobacteria bacterium]|nr:hypothetical protein [Alphaproteobacteria bacterium]
VEENDGGAIVQNSHASVTVNTSSEGAGGLVMENSGIVRNSYATGAVSSSANFETETGVGGLVGHNFGGLVSGSFATGPVSGGANVGGLVGMNDAPQGVLSVVQNSYATGAVSARGVMIGVGSSNPHFQNAVGGLVGSNYLGTIATSYSTGKVTGNPNGSDTGGLLGLLSSNGFGGSVINSYWDTQTSGQLTSAGGTGLTTRQLQGLDPINGVPFSTATNLGDTTGTIWGGGAGGLYPYLKFFFPTGVQAVTGTAYQDAGLTPNASGANGAVSVNVLANGQAVGSATTGANGYYYVFMPAGTIPGGTNQIVAYSSGANGGATQFENDSVSGNLITGHNIYGTYLKQQAAPTSTSLSVVASHLATALGSTVLPSYPNRWIDVTARSFNLDQAINTGTLVLSTAGNVTQSAAAPISAASLVVRRSSDFIANVTLDNPSNTVASLGAISLAQGAFTLVNSGDLTIAGTALTAAFMLSTSGNLTVAPTGTVTAGANQGVVLSAGGDFVNNRGSDAITVSGSGRWLIYSAAPAGDTFGNLDSHNTAVWNATFASAPPASVTQAGNRYLFALQPTLTFTSTNVAKTYGDDATVAVAVAYTTTGLQSGVAGAFLGDTLAAVASGAPSVTSSGSASTAGVAGAPYPITVGQGSLVSLDRYGFAFNSAGKLTVTPKALTVTANSESKVAGTAFTFTGTEFTTSGLVNGDAVTSAALTSSGAPASATAAGSPYAILASNAAGTELSNYAISYRNGVMTLTAAQPGPGNGGPGNGGPGNGPSGNGGSGNAGSNDTSHVVPPPVPGAPNNTTITFQNTPTGPVTFALTTPTFTPGTVTGPGTTNINTATGGDTYSKMFATNNGYDFKPISQYDPNQYSQSTLPDYADQAGLSTLFTILARGVAPDKAPTFLIDTFWNTTDKTPDWTSGGNNPLAARLTFSDGAGHNEAPPGDANAFPIDKSKTDIATLLLSGPVMIGGTVAGRDGTVWLLATRLTDDGKGIVCDDPISGTQIVLGYDASTRTVGGAIGVFDPKSKSVIAYNEANVGTVMSDAGLKQTSFGALDGFAPANYFAVTIGK